MRTWTAWARAATLVAGSVIALAACGVGPSHTLDTASVEHQISTQLAGRYPVGRPAVVCTKGVPAIPGRKFSCSTVVAGQPLHFDGTVTDRKGHFSVTPTAAVIDTARAALVLEKQISDSTRSAAAVSCGPAAVLVVPVGHTFACTARLHGQPPRPVTVTVDDLQGGVRFSLPPLPPAATSASTRPS